MLIKSVKLAPFAGTKDKTFHFKSGLNVVCGRNDVGKSTLMRAIECVLYFEINAKGKTGAAATHQIIPIGGDHATVVFEFEHEGRSYTLEKTWGAGAKCKLTVPGGNVLADDKKIAELMGTILPTSAATFRNVLAAGQNRLEQTIADIKGDDTTELGLGDLIRQTVSQSDGVSAGRFKSDLEEMYEQWFQHWDTAVEGPRNGRGIENKWAKPKPGKILQSWYDRETARKMLEEAVIRETQLGEKTQALAEKKSELEKAQAYVREKEPLIDAARTRLSLNQTATHIREQIQKTLNDIKTWSTAADRIALIEPEVIRLTEVVANLKNEQGQVSEMAKRKQFEERFLKIEKEQSEYQGVKAKLDGHKPVTKADLDVLQNAATQKAQVVSAIAASQLAIELVAKTAFDISVVKDIDPERKQSLTAGEKVVFSACGRILIESEQFSIGINSGDGKLEQMEAKLQAALEKAEEVFKRLGVATLEEARVLLEEYESLVRNVMSVESALKSQLAGESYGELKARFESAPPSGGSRDPRVVNDEFLAANIEKERNAGDLVRIREEIAKFKEVYGCADAEPLYEIIADKKRLEKEALAELSKLPEFIGEAEDLEKEIAQFRNVKDSLDRFNSEIPGLASELASINALMSDKSAQDLERDFLEASEAFERERQHGRAVQKIKDVLSKMEEQSVNIYSDLQESFEKNLALISENKYQRAQLDGSLPTDIVREDGAVVPFTWLSGGSKDSFALALRLALAEYFLKGSEGFAMVDDPMVSMDLGRQEIVSGLLNDFSVGKQLVVFTCHPGHAELLGGSRVEL